MRNGSQAPRPDWLGETVPFADVGGLGGLTVWANPEDA